MIELYDLVNILMERDLIRCYIDIINTISVVSDDIALGSCLSPG